MIPGQLNQNDAVALAYSASLRRKAGLLGYHDGENIAKSADGGSVKS